MMLLISLGSLSSGSNKGLLILHVVICGLQPTCDLQADATAGAGLALHNGDAAITENNAVGKGRAGSTLKRGGCERSVQEVYRDTGSWTLWGCLLLRAHFFPCGRRTHIRTGP